MKRSDLKKLIKECIFEFTYSLSSSNEISAKSLKIGDRVMYNNQGPFEVVSIVPSNIIKNDSIIKLQLPNNPEKWAEIKVDNKAKYFTKVQ